MRKGDIFLAENRENNPHPIVFIEQIDRVCFKACILSHQPTNNNIPMIQEHFHINDENGNPYQIQFENSYLVFNETFIKMTFWLSSEEVKGRLTDIGINFIEQYVNEQPVLCPAPIWKYRPVENNRQ